MSQLYNPTVFMHLDDDGWTTFRRSQQEHWLAGGWQPDRDKAQSYEVGVEKQTLYNTQKTHATYYL